MDKLDDFTLRLIIDYLPVLDKIKVQRVSKRWREQALKSMRQVKYLDLDSDFKGVDLNIDNVTKILSKYGENVKHIEIKENLKPEEMFPLINRFCKNLESLFFFETVVEKNDLDLLTEEVLKNLNNVYFYGNDIKSPSSVDQFLKKAVKLKQFGLCEMHSSFWYVDGYGLQHLSKTITSLDLHAMFINDEDLFTSCMDNLPNLIDINITHTNISYRPLVNVCSQLKVIKVGSSDLLENQGYRKLSFPQLEELHAGSGTCLEDDDFLHFLSEIPKLKILNLYGFDGIKHDEYNDGYDDDYDSGECLKLLAFLKCLEHLDMSQTAISDEVVKYWLSNNLKFKSLVCEVCVDYTLTELGLLEMIKSLPDLKLIKLSSYGLKDVIKLLEETLKLVDVCTNRIPLTITFSRERKINANIEEFKSRMKSRCDALNVKVEFFLIEKGWYDRDERYDQIVKFIPLLKK